MKEDYELGMSMCYTAIMIQKECSRIGNLVSGRVRPFKKRGLLLVKCKEEIRRLEIRRLVAVFIRL